MKKIFNIFFGPPNKRSYRKKIKNRTIIPLGLPKKEVLERKKEFLKIAQKKVKFFANVYDFKYEKITIRDQKTRWGSCSAKGNLNFNYRVFLLPEDLLDYVIVHEVCHLKELNHSKSFWDLVEREITDYRGKRKILKRYFFVII